MKTVCVIPARYQSSRLPGKPLVNINGLPMIKHVWDKCMQFFDDPQKVIIATDDDRIAHVCQDYGMTFVMTDVDCLTGTDRVAYALADAEADVIVNVQGDEPMVRPGDIEKVVFASYMNDVCCGMCDIDNESDFRSPHVPKVVCSENNMLLYMSRAPIPTDKNHSFLWAKKQVCIYSFSSEALQKFKDKQGKSRLEKVEDIEILRFLDMGYNVKMIDVSGNYVSVDTEEDLQKIRNIFY